VGWVGSLGAGHVDDDAAKHLPTLVSQHCTPPATDGQLFWQSESAVQLGAQTLAGGAGGGVVSGGSVVAGAGSVGVDSISGEGSDEAHATVRRAAEKTGRM
jgi:hypothetical protein